MDNLNGLRGYVRMTPTAAAAAATLTVAVAIAIAVLLCDLLLGEHSGYAHCIFDVNNNAQLKVTAKLK